MATRLRKDDNFCDECGEPIDTDGSCWCDDDADVDDDCEECGAPMPLDGGPCGCEDDDFDDFDEDEDEDLMTDDDLT